MSAGRPDRRFDELDAARALVAVIDAGSFVAAARALGRTTSAVSRGVATLERAVGHRLIDRTPDGPRLTEAGALYLTHARRLLGEQAAAHEALQALTGRGAHGVVRITVPTSAERLLAVHLPAFLAENPDLRVEVDVSDAIVPLAERGLDVALRVGALPDSALRAVRVGALELVIAGSPSLDEGRPPLVHPAQLVDWPSLPVAAGPGPVTWEFWPAHGGPSVRVRVSPRITSTSHRLANALAIAGAGLVRTAAWGVRDAIDGGALRVHLSEWRTMPPDQPGLPVWLVIATPAGVDVPARVRALVDFLRERLHEGLRPVPSDG